MKEEQNKEGGELRKEFNGEEIGEHLRNVKGWRL